jgi:hypothetical protein
MSTTDVKDCLLLIFLLALSTLGGCSKSHGLAAEAPPAAKVVTVGDENLFSDEHPEQFPLVSAVAHASAPELGTKALSGHYGTLANGRSLTEGEKFTTNYRYLFASREVRSAKMATCLDLVVDRRQAARFGINVANVQDTVQTAIGGNAVSQVLQGEARYDVVVRYQTPYREERTPGASATRNTLSI